MSKFYYETADSSAYDCLKQFAKDNRLHATQAEKTLWEHLRGTATGHRFRRQHIIGPYIVDFVCLEQSLAIEVDGGYHAERKQMEYDSERDAWLAHKGFTVLRFRNEDIDKGIDRVLALITQNIEHNARRT